jgi:hypothetical protein
MWVVYTRAQIKSTTTVAQPFVLSFALPAFVFVGAGWLKLRLPLAFVGPCELLLLVELLGPGELASPVGFMSLVGVGGAGEFASPLGLGVAGSRSGGFEGTGF